MAQHVVYARRGSAIYGSFSLYTGKKTSLSLEMKGKNFALDQ